MLPKKNAGRDDAVHHHIVAKIHEAVGTERKARITKGRYRVKNRAERIKKHGIMPVQQKGRHRLDAENKGQHLHKKGSEVKIVPKQCLAHGFTAGEGHMVAPEQKNNACIGHDAEAAQLHEQKQHGLAKRAEHDADVHGRKPCDAHGGCGKKGRVNQAEAVPFLPARGRVQQGRPDGNNRQE